MSTVQSIINDYWDRRARPYDAYQRHGLRFATDQAAWTRVFSQALPDEAAQILDVGTGSGYLAFLLTDLGRTVTATDLSAGMLQTAAQHAESRAQQDLDNPSFRLGDAIDPDFPPERFDAIVNRYVMWTLRDPVTALLNWKKLLRPGGVIAVVDAPWFPHGIEANTTEGFTEHYSGAVSDALPLAEARSIEETVSVFHQAGFDQVSVTALTEILALDQANGAAPGHHVQLQHLITAVKSPEVNDQFSHAEITREAVRQLEPQLDAWTSALTLCADPTRLRILVALHAAPEATVSQLSEATGATPNTVTQALRRLDDAGVAAVRQDGRHRRWRLTDQRIHHLLHHISAPHSPLHPSHS